MYEIGFFFAFRSNDITIGTMKKIIVNIDGSSIEVEKYSTILDAFATKGIVEKDRGYSYLDNPVVGAKVNGEIKGLRDVLTATSSLEPIYVFDSLGRRIYRHSICFLLSYAATLVSPERHLVIGHSLGDGFYFSFEDDEYVDDVTVDKIRVAMERLVRDSVNIEYETLSEDEALEILAKHGNEKTRLLLCSRNKSTLDVYRIGTYIQLSYEPIVPNTSMLSVWELRKYGDKGMLLRYPVSQSVKEIVKFRDNPLLFKVFEEYKTWGKVLGVRSLGEMNRVTVTGGSREYVKLCEDLHRRKIASIADKIKDKGAKIVFIAGPSSSGKTTFAQRLSEELRLLGFKPFKISLDDYYNPPSMAPLDKDGKPDLEALEALNVDLIDSNMESLLEGRPVNLPQYDFNTHITTFSAVPVQMGEKTIMVVEGIHALNKRITEGIDQRFIYKVYISALTHINLDDSNRISTSDNRLLRRIVRDYRTRGMSAERTLNMWDSVTRGETEHIYPNQNNADVMFNSALDYEIGVLSTYVIPLLSAVGKDEGKAYTISRRLLSFLENVYPIPGSYVPSDSLLREFIGESDYEH